jgi:Zn-dependent protease
MSWSLTIGRFGATTLRVHLTFFLLLAWIGVSAWLKGGAPAARDSVLFIALIFGCVVLHEFGHILMARRFGIVILLPIGGVALMPRMPEKPAQELAVAVAGPTHRHRSRLGYRCGRNGPLVFARPTRR